MKGSPKASDDNKSRRSNITANYGVQCSNEITTLFWLGNKGMLIVLFYRLFYLVEWSHWFLDETPSWFYYPLLWRLKLSWKRLFTNCLINKTGSFSSSAITYGWIQKRIVIDFLIEKSKKLKELKWKWFMGREEYWQNSINYKFPDPKNFNFQCAQTITFRDSSSRVAWFLVNHSIWKSSTW